MKILQKLTIFALLSTVYGTAWGMESKVTMAATTEAATLSQEIREAKTALSPQARQAVNQYNICQDVNSIAWAPNGALFYANLTGVFCSNPATTVEPVLLIPFDFDKKTREDMEYVSEHPIIALSNDGSQLAVTFAHSFTIHLWDISTKSPKKLKSIRLEPQLTYRIESAFFNAHGTGLVVCLEGGYKPYPIRFYQVSFATEEMALLEGPTAIDTSTTDSKEMDTVSVFGVPQETVTTIFKLERQIQPLWVKFSPKKKYFITASKVDPKDSYAHMLTIWETATGRPLKTICDYKRIDVLKEYKADGVTQKNIYTDTNLRIADSFVTTGSVDHFIAFSPDERYLAIKGTLYPIDDSLRIKPTVLKFIDIEQLNKTQQQNKLQPRKLTDKEWLVLQEFDDFSRLALMQNLKLLPPVEETAVATSGSAGAAAEAKKS